ncbi:hypothetical protein D9M69_649230 [compost metagenome]
MRRDFPCRGTKADWFLASLFDEQFYACFQRAGEFCIRHIGDNLMKIAVKANFMPRLDECGQDFRIGFCG